MATWQKIRKRKVSGGKYKRLRDKRKFELGNAPVQTKISDKDVVKVNRGRGGTEKLRAFVLSYANVLDPVTKKVEKAKLKKVLENKASRHYARMSVITKGAIIETSAGKAKVTNRPGQDGIINAVKV